MKCDNESLEIFPLANLCGTECKRHNAAMQRESVAMQRESVAMQRDSVAAVTHCALLKRFVFIQRRDAVALPAAALVAAVGIDAGQAASHCRVLQPCASGVVIFKREGVVARH